MNENMIPMMLNGKLAGYKRRVPKKVFNSVYDQLQSAVALDILLGEFKDYWKNKDVTGIVLMLAGCAGIIFAMIKIFPDVL